MGRDAGYVSGGNGFSEIILSGLGHMSHQTREFNNHPLFRGSRSLLSHILLDEPRLGPGMQLTAGGAAVIGDQCAAVSAPYARTPSSCNAFKVWRSSTRQPLISFFGEGLDECCFVRRLLFAQIWEAFCAFDLDKNKFVGAAEIRHVLVNIGEQVFFKSCALCLVSCTLFVCQTLFGVWAHLHSTNRSHLCSIDSYIPGMFTSCVNVV